MDLPHLELMLHFSELTGTLQCGVSCLLSELHSDASSKHPLTLRCPLLLMELLKDVAVRLRRHALWSTHDCLR
eukprot:6188710-Pleurochrysis_carterae.AAC.2